ncbi:MAG TPA: hypothetical protein VMY76_06660 [Gemmatimonadales bacterium]|nr:hypothetical protein [Gemmatimonadales bacterium]
MKSKYPPPIRPTHIERHAKAIRDIDRKSAALQERLEHTSDPERVVEMETKLRTLEEERTVPAEELSEWYRGLPEAEQKKHEDFLRRCNLERQPLLRVP